MRIKTQFKNFMAWLDRWGQAFDNSPLDYTFDRIDHLQKQIDELKLRLSAGKEVISHE